MLCDIYAIRAFCLAAAAGAAACPTAAAVTTAQYVLCVCNLGCSDVWCVHSAGARVQARQSRALTNTLYDDIYMRHMYACADGAAKRVLKQYQWPYTAAAMHTHPHTSTDKYTHTQTDRHSCGCVRTHTQSEGSVPLVYPYYIARELCRSMSMDHTCHTIYAIYTIRYEWIDDFGIDCG